MGQTTEVHLPDIGDFRDVEVIEVLVAPGDQVAVEQSIITLESEKATMEIPSPQAGKVAEVKIAVGDKINQGQLLLVMDTEDVAAPAAAEQGEPAPPEPAAEEVEAVQAPAPEAATPPPPTPRLPGDKEPRDRPVIARPSDAPKGRAHASPAVRRFARELGVDLMAVPGSGHKGRILKEDVQDFVKQTLAAGGAAAPAVGGAFQLPAAPEVDWERFGPTAERPLTRIQKISGPHLHRAWVSVPHVTQFDQADISDLEAFRKQQKAVAEAEGVKLTFMPFLMKACVAALRAMPRFNSALSTDGQQLIERQFFHLGIAVDTPDGLVVPVIRDVDQKGVFDLARELAEVSQRARDGKLTPADLQGGCFSISSLGGIGGTQFTPIVNAPQVAILGVSRAAMQPVWNGSEFVPRLIMPFSLSYDHRVIDGVQGVRFTGLLSALLSDIRRLLL